VDLDAAHLMMRGNTNLPMMAEIIKRGTTPNAMEYLRQNTREGVWQSSSHWNNSRRGKTLGVVLRPQHHLPPGGINSLRAYPQRSTFTDHRDNRVRLDFQ
jgi:hypothetical protein